MKRYFEIADRVIEKVTHAEFGANNKKEQYKETYTELWNIPESHIPKFESGLNFVLFRAAEEVVVQSMWKGFMGAANAGLNMVTSKLNNLFSGEKEDAKADYGESFKPAVIHTGVKVSLPEDEILTIYNITNGEDGLIFANGIQVIKSIDKTEIELYVYNMLPNNIKINYGQVVAIGMFSKIQSSLDLSKE